MAVVTIATPGRAVNTLGSAGLQDLEDLLAELETAADLRGLVLASSLPGTFLVGVDLDELERLEEPGPAREWVQRGQQLVERWRRLPYPTVAAIRGAALGGGLEIALACTFRVASDEPATVLGLPEVELGLLPALGGTWALPRQVGLRRGLEMLLTGQRLDARAALACGLIDERVPAAILDRAARAWLARGPRAASRRARAVLLAADPVSRRLFLAAARRRVRRKTGGHYPAPHAILDAVAAGYARGRRGALRVEAERFGELAVSPVSRNLIWLFRSGRPEGERPAAGGVVGVVGAGFMGAGIAALAARHGYRVRLQDSRAEALGPALRAARGRGLLAPTTRLTGLARAELVIEAVTEDLEVKRAVLAAVESQVSESA
ncbi:MAG TPA: enoyl-CoA hydratase-related protein, partial [Thermoanaerobaculia bacterium]|nr:enoyl-CoA hydratase-related protein [Thermoanaerobaculia bacterium]